MKKVLAAVLCAAMVSLTACGGNGSSAPAATTAAAKEAETEAQLTPEEVYQAALEKNAELDSLDVATKITMQMTVGEESMEMVMDMDMQAEGQGTDDIRCLINTTTEVDGDSVEMVMFYVDGYYYMDVMGQKLKYAMDPSEMAAQTEDQVSGAALDVDWFSELTMEEQGGKTILKFVGDPDKMYSYVEETMASSGNDLSGMDMTINGISGEYTINEDGYYENMKMLMDISLDIEDEAAGMVMDIDMDFRNPGQSVSVEIPEIDDDYMDIDPEMLG